MAKRKPLTLAEFCSLGGHARKQSLSPEKRSEIARKAGLASVEARRAKKNLAA